MFPFSPDSCTREKCNFYWKKVSVLLLVQRHVALSGRLSRGDAEQHPAVRLLLPRDGLHLLLPRPEPGLTSARADEQLATDRHRLSHLYLAPPLPAQHDLIQVAEEMFSL